jgi:hypothetical protein
MATDEMPVKTVASHEAPNAESHQGPFPKPVSNIDVEGESLQSM